MAYSSEAKVVEVISSKFEEAGSKAKVSFYSDTQGNSTIERKAVFKVAIAAKDSEPIVNKVYDMELATDRRIRYKGSQVEPTEQGEMRYIFFETMINPREDY